MPIPQLRVLCLSAGANNLIPMEIALKVANKIRAHQRFSVYIIIPMWPEGVPTSTAIQRILFWQVISNYHKDTKKIEQFVREKHKPENQMIYGQTYLPIS